MDKNTEKNNWVYIPHDGESIGVQFEEFRNNPIPSDEVIENIGVDEVTKIDSRVKEMMQWREIMYGTNSKKVDYRVGNLYFTNPDFPNIKIRCSALADFIKYKKEMFTSYQGKATIKDYLIEIESKVSGVIK
jgi:hypothetical protein